MSSNDSKKSSPEGDEQKAKGTFYLTADAANLVGYFMKIGNDGLSDSIKYLKHKLRTVDSATLMNVVDWAEEHNPAIWQLVATEHHYRWGHFKGDYTLELTAEGRLRIYCEPKDNIDYAKLTIPIPDVLPPEVG